MRHNTTLGHSASAQYPRAISRDVRRITRSHDACIADDRFASIRRHRFVKAIAALGPSMKTTVSSVLRLPENVGLETGVDSRARAFVARLLARSVPARLVADPLRRRDLRRQHAASLAMAKVVAPVASLISHVEIIAPRMLVCASRQVSAAHPHRCSVHRARSSLRSPLEQRRHPRVELLALRSGADRRLRASSSSPFATSPRAARSC